MLGWYEWCLSSRGLQRLQNSQHWHSVKVHLFWSLTKTGPFLWFYIKFLEDGAALVSDWVCFTSISFPASVFIHCITEPGTFRVKALKWGEFLHREGILGFYFEKNHLYLCFNISCWGKQDKYSSLLIIFTCLHGNMKIYLLCFLLIS